MMMAAGPSPLAAIPLLLRRPSAAAVALAASDRRLGAPPQVKKGDIYHIESKKKQVGACRVCALDVGCVWCACVRARGCFGYGVGGFG